ncbi:hypothetical protein [Cytobacillus gottheilii]|uniref:hypothetical protein n=1 Tax=Cytobacillus gottheilii TaxID=859144 RepID=UPI0009BA6D7E|nr:hypothetical protein [Cytobacillus gottheilii]
MFKTKKSKRYWLLMPPFLIVGILLVIFLPQHLKPIGTLIGLPFWIVYYTWNYLSEKNIKKEAN